MTSRQQNVLNIKGNVQNLVSVNEVKGDFVNNGIIYLMATYEACHQLVKTGMSAAAFKAAAENYIDMMKKYHSRPNILGMMGQTSLSDYYILPRMAIIGQTSEEINVSVENLGELFSHEETFIYGPAGAGKSSFLKFVILNILDLKIGAIPVFISLASFRSKCRLKPSHTLYEQIVQELKEYKFSKKFVDFMLENAPVILLLDGFDEGYRDLDEKALLTEQIESYSKIHNSEWSKVVITSRTKDYLFFNPQRQNLELLPFDKDQVNSYLEKRLGNNTSVTQFLDKVTSYYDITFENRNTSDSPEMDWVYERTSLMGKGGLVAPEVHDVTLKERTYPDVLSSPILLSLLLFQFEQEGRVNGNKVALLESLVKHIIDINKNKSGKKLDDVFSLITPAKLEKLFTHLAYHTLKAGEIIIEQSRLFSLTENFLQLNSIPVSIGLERLFKPIVNDFGLLSAVGNNQFRFLHLFIQDYLAATFLNDNDSDGVFTNRLLLREEWSRTISLLIEMRGEDADFTEKYFAITRQLVQASEKVKELVEPAQEKALDVDGKGCCGIAFYYICMRLYFNTGDRAVYASLRIAAEILHRVLGTPQKNAVFTLFTISQEMTYVATKISHQNLLVDSWLFRLFEHYVKKIDVRVSIDEVITAINATGHTSLTPMLDELKSAVEESNEPKIIATINGLLTERKLSLQDWLPLEDLNILCKWLDMVESYLRVVPEFGKVNYEYSSFFTGNTEHGMLYFSTDDQDYLTSKDYFELGWNYEKADKVLAEKYITKAIAKNPTSSVYYFYRAVFFAQNGNPKKSLADFISAERLNSGYDKDYQFQLLFGVLYKRMSEYEKANQRFKQASEIDSDGVESRCFSVEVCLKTNQFDKAASISLELTAILPNEGHFFYTTAYCYMRLTKYNEAVKIIEVAIQLKYSIPQSYFIKAYCQLQLGNTAEVQVWLNAYLKKSPGETFLYLLLLHSYKLDKNKKLYDLTRKKVLKNNLLQADSLLPLPLSISPGHLEIKRFGDTYHAEDFLLPLDYI